MSYRDENAAGGFPQAGGYAQPLQRVNSGGFGAPAALYEQRSQSDSAVFDEPADGGAMVPTSPLEPPASPNVAAENFKVFIRVRPPVQRELEAGRFVNVVRIPGDHKNITLCEHLDGAAPGDAAGGVYSTQSFGFDYVYDETARQHEVYERSAHPAVSSMLQGYNATVMAYGQTGTGKTYTMEGFTSDEHRGIIPFATEAVFNFIRSCNNPDLKFQVRASYLQIYKENLSDLLKPASKSLTIRQSKQRVFVDGLSEWVVRSPGEIYGLIERGVSLRATGSTKMSELSSRSHAIFQIIVEILEGDYDAPASFKVGKLNIVDLAGSEKVRATGVSGIRLEETKKINWSLHQLGNVISALTDPAAARSTAHIPYRNSKLTHLLTDSLGGNCKTTLIACISPALESYAESLSTLKFANRAKNIKNSATVNEDLDQRNLIAKYEKELTRLRQIISNGGGSAGGPAGALAGRDTAQEALEERERDLTAEKRSKQRLEERVVELESLLVSSGVVDEAGARLPGGLAAAQQHHAAAAVAAEEDLAQVERYKQLLLKQRDIMLNLTTRLNERDETILRLQEEIDAYDAHLQMLEDALEAQAPHAATRADAEAALAARRAGPGDDGLAVAVVGGGGGGGGGEARYRAEGPSGALLSAEEKLIELMMLKGVGKARWESAPATPSGSQFASPLHPSALHADPAAVPAAAAEVARLEAALAQEHARAAEQQQRLERDLAHRTADLHAARAQAEAAERAAAAAASATAAGGGAEAAAELAAARKQLATHVKDRAALKKILESRIRLKVDNIAAVALRGEGDRARLEAEVTSLQNLVAASINAMNADH